MKQIVQSFLFIAALLLTANQGLTQSLSCNDQINVSVNSTCGIDLGVDAFMEGSDADLMSGLYTYTILHNGVAIVNGDINGPTFGGDDMSPYINLTLTFEVRYQGSANYCWGYILIEDKIPPTITCDCPEGGNGFGGYDPECILSCYEIPVIQNNYYAPLVNDIILSDTDDLLAGVSDNCNNSNVNIGFSDQITALPNCQGSILKRTFAINGYNIPISVCTKEYFIEPLILDDRITAPFTITGGAPVPQKIENTLLLPKKTVEIPSCGVGNDPASIANFFDNSETTDQDTDDNGIDPDEFDIDLVVENNEGTWYAYPHYYIKGRGVGGLHAQAIDNSICTILTGFSDVQVDVCSAGCAGNSKTVRTWTLLDWCTGQHVTYDQIIKIVDGEGPTITVNDIHASVDPWECTATINFPAPEHLFDACDNIISYSVLGGSSYNQVISGNSSSGFVANNVPVGIHQFRYLANDCCGNTTTAYVKVVVQDYTPPVSISKEYIVTSLTNVSDPYSIDNGISKIFAVNFDNGSYDGCTDVTLEVRRVGSYCFPEDTVWGDFVKFCCADLNGQAFVNIDVELRVMDLFGNTNKTWSSVRLEDKSGPAIFCPQPMILQCDMDINDFTMTGLPEGISACGEYEYIPDFDLIKNNTKPRDKPAGTPPLYYIDSDDNPDMVPAYSQGCGFGAIRRQFRENGRIICEQWFVIESSHVFDPGSIVFPNNMTVDCDDYDTGEPTYDQTSCTLIGVTVESDTFRLESGACMQILKHWSIIDWCTYNPQSPNAGGLYKHTQIISIVDREDPVVASIDSLLYPVGVDCLSKGVVLTATGTDNGKCGSEWIAWDIDVDLDSDWISDYHYGSYEPRTVNGEPNPFYVPKSTSGEAIDIVLPDGIEGSKKYHRIVWKANDGCGNLHSITRYFLITDVKAPTPYCLNLSTAFMQNGEVELWAADFNVNSFDNCTAEDNLFFTFTDRLPPVRNDSEYGRNDTWYDTSFWFYDVTNGDYESLDDYGGDVHRWEPGLRSSGKIFTEADLDADGFVTVPVYVWDGCNNIDFCNVNLRILDNDGGGAVAGRIVNQDGEAMAGIMTQLDAAMPGYPRQEMTDNNGEYAFTNAPFNLDYMLTAVPANDDYLNGVSTLDIVLIQRHILGQSRFDEPMKMIAADVNNDKNITAIDLIELRKLILGVNDELPNSDSWRFLTNSADLEMVNPWQYQTDNMINVMTTNMINQNFVALKVGDVNDSAVTAVGQTVSEKRTDNVVKFSIKDQKVIEGEQIEISIHTDEVGIQGFQFEMAYNSMTLVDVQSSIISDEHFSNINNVLSFSYNSSEAIATDDYLTLTFKVNASAQLSNLINTTGLRLKAEAYVGSKLDVNPLVIAFENTTEETQLLQNRPNPFAKNTVVGFILSDAGSAEINMFDVNGRLLKNIKGDYPAGYNEITIDRSSLTSTGLIYYQLRSGDYTATKHMVLID